MFGPGQRPRAEILSESKEVSMRTCRSASSFTPFALAGFFLVPLCSPLCAQRFERAQAKLHPHMSRLLDEHGPVKGWVFFRDKGLPDAQAVKAALDRAEAELGQRQRARRELRRQRSGLVDWYDIPVAKQYIQSVESSGVRVAVSSSWLNAISVRGDRARFEVIAALDCVDRIEPVRRGISTDGLGKQTLTRTGTQRLGGFYGLAENQLLQLNLVALHNRGFTGAGVLIGILDTGFHRGHEAFNQPGHVVNVVAEQDFVDGDANSGVEPGDPSSQHSHGTYILGCIAAYLPNELVGAAYDASFVLAKTEDTTGEYQQEEDFYVAGLQFIEAQGADVATSSLGYIDWYDQSDLNGLTAITTMGVNVATDNGLFCLTAAGNSGNDSNPSTSSLIAPADALEVLTIGAVDELGAIVSFSSDGPTADGRTKPELLGTGFETWTVCSSTDTNCTVQVSGTSLSTPLLAGMVACLVQARPTWTVGQMRARLFRTGDFNNGMSDPDFVRGYGIPDADEAAFDCNGNGIDDGADISGGVESDCNANGFPDSCDIADGISADVGADGMPDECRRRGVAQATGSLSSAAPVSLPLIVAPPYPQVGKPVRAIFDLTTDRAGNVPVLSVKFAGEVVGRLIGTPIDSSHSALEIDFSLPRDASLAGREFELQIEFYHPGSRSRTPGGETRILIRP